MGDVVDLPSAPAPGASIGELIKCVDRELAFRSRVYPRWVEKKKLAQVTADQEMARMRAVRARLVLADAERTVLTGLAERLQLPAVELALLVRKAHAMSAALFPEQQP